MAKLTCIFRKMKIECEIFPAGTDSDYLREVCVIHFIYVRVAKNNHLFVQIGLPAFGFSPINNTPILLHDHDEFLEESVFLKGITIYEAIIASLANAPN